MTLFSPVNIATMADVESKLYNVPAGTSSSDSPRFAGEPVWWMKIRPSGQAQAFVNGARRVFSAVSPGLPGGNSTLTAIVLEITPMPRSNAALLGRLPGGTPVQYVLIYYGDLTTVATPDLQISVAGGTSLVTAGSAGCWIGFVRQDRICRDPRAWADELDAAIGSNVDPSWTAYTSRVRSLVQPTVRLVDHRGQPLTQGSFSIAIGGGPAQTVTLTGSSGDTGVVLTGSGQVAPATADAANTVLASTASATGALGAPVAVSPTDRQLAMLELGEWMPARTTGVTGIPRWSTGNFVEPIVDGLPYFARLVPDLRAAEHGGAVGLAGWAFVKEALYDRTKVWSLLPEDNSTELVKLMHELKANGAQVRLLATRMLQISDAELDALRTDVGVALLAACLLMQAGLATRVLSLDPAGWVAAGFAAAIVPLLPDATMFEAIRHFAEPSKSAVDAINGNDPDTAQWTPHPATLADNPLADNPLHIAGVPLPMSHVGVYHEKIAAMQAAGQPPIAYVGGIDLNSDRLDNPNHRAYAPFHDVQVRLAGPAVADIVNSFAERAAVAGTSSPLTLPGGAWPAAGSHIVQLGRTRFAPGSGSGHGSAFPSAPAGEDSTHAAIVASIEVAQDYIYIEEQYFTPDKAYVDALVAAGNKSPHIQALVITLPDQADQPYGAERRGEIIAQLATTWGDRLRIGAPMRRYLNPTPQLFGGLGRLVLRDAITTLDNTTITVGPAERLPAVPFWAFIESELVYVDTVVPGGPGTGPVGTQDPEEPDSPTQTWQQVTIQRAPLGQDPRWGAKPDKHDKNSCVLAVQLPGIYVHAKVMMVDDIFMSVGSSNLNRRGFFHDGETNIFVVPERLRRDPANPALRLRCRLWAEHFGLPAEMGLSLFADPISALPFFDRSWYRGSHWMPLRFVSSTLPPAVVLSIPNSIPGVLIDTFKNVVTVAERSTIWATLVDPTTSLDPHTGAGDKGPDL
jgi:phosphatidylserine/phosphatidylglycerophosphate/cardiolipin synthase-like enzyme